MASEGIRGGTGPCAGSGVGLVDVDDGNEVVRGIFPCQSASVSGLLRYRADTHGADIVRPEEMGLLDSLAFCEYRQSDTIPEGGTGVHADSKLSVSGEWYMVTVYMVQTV